MGERYHVDLSAVILPGPSVRAADAFTELVILITGGSAGRIGLDDRRAGEGVSCSWTKGKPVRLIALSLLCTFAMSLGCGSSSQPNADIPPDPNVEAPPPATGPLSPSVTIGASDPDNPGRVSLIVGGVGFTTKGTSGEFRVVRYTDENLTIVEDGVVQGKLIIDAPGLKVDVALIIDNTGSMAEEIDGVRQSVLNFFGALDDGGQDVQAGVVAYNDGLFPDFPNDVLTDDTRASPAVFGWRDLTTDFSESGELFTFIADLPATDPGANFDLPELAFGGLDYARRSFSWRSDAQRIYILITDATAWGLGFRIPNDKGIDAEYFTDESLASLLRAEGSVVHVYAPAPIDNLATGEYNVRPLALRTGGIFTELDRTGQFDLLELGIIETTLASSQVDFVKNGPPDVVEARRVRVVVSTTDGETVVDGERTLDLVY
ncbi:MAG: vWA domain-containing protein [Myxococcota bacterium]